MAGLCFIQTIVRRTGRLYATEGCVQTRFYVGGGNSFKPEPCPQMFWLQQQLCVSFLLKPANSYTGESFWRVGVVY